VLSGVEAMQSDQSESQQTNTGEASSQESTPAQGDLGATGTRPEAESERSDRDDDGAVTGAQAELEATKDRYLRLAAEFDNFRKRTDRERIESRDRAQGELLEQILDSLDDLQRVAELDAEKTTVDALLEGIRMVERKLLKALE